MKELETYLQYSDARCPVCKSLFEECGAEEFKAGYRLVICDQCGYTFDVEA